MMKLFKRFLRLIGVKQFMFIYQTKKRREAEVYMGVREFIAWMVMLIPEVAKVNDITPLTLASEIKKYIKDDTRKEQQNEDSAERTPPDLSDTAGIDSNSDRS